MSSIEATAPAVAVPAPAARPQTQPPRPTGHFLGSEAAFFWLLVRGHLLLMVTLGIYRFWLNTDVRRFLWGHTEVAGDGFEYNGTARELLIGFLMAIVLLVPINVLLFIGTLVPGLLPFAGPLGVVLLALLGQFAVYRARRYRLSRTVYRGLRLFQTGSAWNYSLRSNLWTLLIILTAGLAYPWAAANLERYKMRHTHYGNLTGHFAGSGTRLFLRGFLLWLIVMGPFVTGLGAGIAAIDWPRLATAVLQSGSDPMAWIAKGGSEAAAAMALAGSAIVWSVIAALVLYPVFRAMVLRWWISGIRLGGVEATSRLRTGQIYRTYLRFLWYAFLFGLAASIVAGLVAALFTSLARDIGSADFTEIGAVVLALIGYVAVMLGYSAIYQATVMIRIWRLSFETTELAGIEALDQVEARGEASGVFGEGLADALDVGGL